MTEQGIRQRLHYNKGWRVFYEVGNIVNDVWNVANDVWHVVNDVWNVVNDVGYVGIGIANVVRAVKTVKKEWYFWPGTKTVQPVIIRVELIWSVM